MQGNTTTLIARTRLFLTLCLAGLTALMCQPLHAQTISSPVHKYVNSSKPGWWITQFGSGEAGLFENNSSSNIPALKGSNSGQGDGILGVSNANYYAGVHGYNGFGTGGGYGVFGEGFSGVGVYGTSGNAYSQGVLGFNQDGTGVGGYSTNFVGVIGSSQNDSGVLGEVYSGGQGVYGYSHGNGVGVYGYSASGYAGYFNGDVAYTGSLTHVSDARFKSNIQTLPNALDAILHLRGVTFGWRHREFPNMNFDKGQQIGFIAQEVEKVLPELVSKDGKGYLSMDYVKVVPVLVEAIKTLDKQVNGEKTQISVLRHEVKQVDALAAENGQLKAQLANQASRLARLEHGGKTPQHENSQTASVPALGSLFLLFGGVGGGCLLRRLHQS